MSDRSTSFCDVTLARCPCHVTTRDLFLIIRPSGCRYEGRGLNVLHLSVVCQTVSPGRSRCLEILACRDRSAILEMIFVCCYVVDVSLSADADQEYITFAVSGGSVAEWLACRTQARKSTGSNRSLRTLSYLASHSSSVFSSFLFSLFYLFGRAAIKVETTVRLPGERFLLTLFRRAYFSILTWGSQTTSVAFRGSQQ